MSQHLPLAPHFPVCLHMLTLATRYARCFDVLDDRTLSSPQATERIARQIKTIKALAEDVAEAATASLNLPMSLIDHTDRTVGSRMAQLQVVSNAATGALERAVESSAPASFTSLDVRLGNVEAARDLLATAAADLIACAERVAAEMNRYRSSYSIPEAGHPLTAEQFQALRLVASGAVSVDEEGQPWVGMDKTAVRASVIRSLDRRDLVAPERSASWADEIHVLPTPAGRLVLATALGRPEHGAPDARSAPRAALAGPAASVQKARR
ncbi:hypothetical protein ACWGI1_00295 [Streptomyces sp. NPDC054835]|uniref:hypothetical protein n=1 Tax=Streptomyces exfoliatus TaxID=1905 RepID=UPI00046558FC|nr:hypothetical protein [Streptomyces exfoliatus]